MNEQLTKLAEKISLLRKGVPQLYFFDDVQPNSVIAIRKAVIEFKQANPLIEEIDVLIHSGGGLAGDAYRIIRTLRNNFKTVNIIVPFWAKSAATLITLGASKIIMDEFSELGPLDAQLGKPRDDSPEYIRESALNDESSLSIIENRYKLMFEQMYLRLYTHSSINIPKTEVSQQLLKNLSVFFKPLLSQINPYKLGEKKRILETGGEYAKRILNQFGPTNNLEHNRLLVNYLLSECPDHGYVIDWSIISKLMTNVYESDIFGSDYKITLQELSLYLMEETTMENFIELVLTVDDDSHGNDVSSQSGSENSIAPDDDLSDVVISKEMQDINLELQSGQIIEGLNSN